MANKVYRAGVIGVGRAGQDTGEKGGGHHIGYQHASAIKGNPSVELATCADINAANLKAFQDRFGVTKGHASYKEMLEIDRPDIVTIGTYVGLHAQIIVDAAHAGVKGIVCEKPFLSSITECNLVRRIASETGVKIVVAHIRRYLPAFQRARELYTTGAVGKPVMCVAGIAGWDLSEWGSHWLDMFRFFHNDQPINWVFGQARVRNFRGYGHAMEDHATAYFEFENGGKALLDGGASIGDATMTLIGTEGTIKIEGESKLVVQSANGEIVEDFADHPNNSYSYIWDCLFTDLVGWIEGGPEPIVGFSTVIKTSELNLAAYLSAIRGDRIDFPLDAGSGDDFGEWPVEILARRRS